MKKSIFALSLSLLTFLTNINYAYAAEIAQEIEVKEITTHKEIKLTDYKDKYILLDFWATWCGPCISSIPHYNELQKKFSEKLKIIAVTGEDEKTVINFLKTHKVDFTIVLDNENKTNQKYPHIMIPFTVIINPKGEIVGDFHPTELTENKIQEIIAGKVSESSIFTKKTEDNIENNLSYMTISKANNEQPDLLIGRMKMNNGGIINKVEATNLNLKNIYKYALNSKFATSQIIDSLGEASKEKYNFKSKLFYNNNDDKMQSMIINYLDSSTGTKSSIEKKKIKVKLLKIIDAKKIIKSNSEEISTEFGDNYLKAKFIDSGYLTEMLSSLLSMPVINQTDLKDNIDISLSWTTGKTESLKPSLEKVGFTLEDAEKEMDILTLSK